jgi:6-phospho-3-hexuloisomerase
MDHDLWIETALKGIQYSIKEMREDQILDLSRKIASACRIFLIGSGRTGLISQSFGLRLTQLGFLVHLVSFPTTPSLEKDDFLVMVSGSGKTETVLLAADRALQIGAQTFLITQQADSPLGKKIQDKLIIHSPERSDRVLNGTLFEMALLFNLDAVINQLQNITDQTFEDMSSRHANLE